MTGMTGMTSDEWDDNPWLWRLIGGSTVLGMRRDEWDD